MPVKCVHYILLQLEVNGFLIGLYLGCKAQTPFYKSLKTSVKESILPVYVLSMIGW